LMRSFVDERNLGQIVGPGVRVRLDETTQLIPDAFFLTPDQKPSRTIRSVFDGVPTLVLEMTQPWGDEHHLENKIKTYQFAQVGEIWLVNADQGEVTVGTPTPNRRRGYYDNKTVTTGVVRSSVIPGFWIDVDWIWSNPHPDPMTCLRQILQ